MGTSTARRGPTGPVWRRAKGTATRYLASEAAAPATAQEVMASYVAALEGGEGEGGFLAQFLRTRQVAQELGFFLEVASTRGWMEACQSKGLEAIAKAPPEVAAPTLAASLSGPAGSLEMVAARVALTEVLAEAMYRRADEGTESTPARLLGQFLSRTITVRSVLDLGESLEFAAATSGQLREALAALRQTVDQAAAPAEEIPADWRGLSGWQWTTQILLDLRKILGPAKGG